MDYQRARTDEQINDRIYQIVEAAKQIYQESGYEGLSFSKISQHTKFTRPNIYKYFNTKDEILLVILKDELEKYIISFISKFDRSKRYTAREISEIWADVFLENSYFLEIYSLLYIVIEKNTSVEALISFKKEAQIFFEQLNNFVSTLFPTLDKAKVSLLARDVLMSAYGFYVMTNKNENQEKASKVIIFDRLHIGLRENLISRIYKDIYCLEHGIE